MQGRGDAQVHRVHVLPGEEGGKVRGDEGDLMPVGTSLGALAALGADADDLDACAPERGEILQVKRRAKAGTHHSNPDRLHDGSFDRAQVPLTAFAQFP
jgi:hypothetical protein